MFELDVLLKNVLNDEVDPLEQDIEKNFLKFKMHLFDNESKKYYIKRISFINFRKVAVIIICCLFCAITILISSSSTVRAAALDVIDSIKVIFKPELSGNDIKIVQKLTSDVTFTPSVSSGTSLSDTKISEKVGFKILFPNNLTAGFRLLYRTIGVNLRKKVSYDSMAQLWQQMQKACENQDEFIKLFDYSPFRSTTGFYIKGDTTICISSSPIIGNILSSSENEEIKIGAIKGFWCKYKYPDYPYIYKDGINQADFSVKPVLIDKYKLDWVNNDLQYSLLALRGNTLSKEEAIEIATEFQAAQPK